MDADRAVRDFCALWGKGDIDGIVESFAEDAVYHNVPMAPLHGKPAIREFIQTFVAGSGGSVSFAILHQLVDGSRVMNERVDTLVLGDRTVELPVCGVFELRDDGRIQAWRDYFDMAAFAGVGGGA